MRFVKVLGTLKSLLVGNDGTPLSVTGGKLDVNASLNTDGLATEAGQDATLSELQRKPNVGDVGIVDLLVVLRNILNALANPAYVDKSANQVRVNVQTGALSSVTTITTVTGLTNIDSYQGKLLMVGINTDAWANTCRRLIS